MESKYYILGIQRPEKDYIYFTGDEKPTPALELAFRYGTPEDAKLERDIKEKSITASYNRFLELVSENALTPVYPKSVFEAYQAIADGGLVVLEVKITQEVIS